jgi:hypothetical protein
MKTTSKEAGSQCPPKTERRKQKQKQIKFI